MSGLKNLFGGSNQTTTPDYTGLQIQTAVNTLPIPILWGTSKLAPNVIWYNDFQTYYGFERRRQRQPFWRWWFQRHHLQRLSDPGALRRRDQ